MIKIRFSEYNEGSITEWQDWSQYLVEAPTIGKKAESENPGEAGLVVFDKTALSFQYENGNPVYAAFSGELTDKQRYMFEIYEHKRVKIGNDSDWVKVFEGLADFTTIEWPEYETVISFDVVEKISALSILEAALPRISGNVNPDVNSDPTADSLVFLKKTDSLDVMMCYADIAEGSEYVRSISGPNSIAVVDGTLKSASLANTPNAGAIIKENFLHDQSEDSGYFFLPTAKKIVTIPVKKCNYVNGQYVDAGTTNIDFVIYKAISDNAGFYNEGTPFQANVVNARTAEWYKELFHNKGIYLRRPGVTYIYYDKLYLRQIPPNYAGAGYYVLDYNPGFGIGGSVSTKTEVIADDYEIYAFDGIKIIEAIVKQQWPDISIVNNTGQENYPIPLEYFNSLLDENPFGEHPLDALKMIADSMKCYIYTDKKGRFVIQKKTLLGDNGIARNIGTTIKIDGGKRYCWNKLVDAVEIKVKSWIMGSDQEYLEGYAYLSKNPNIQPRNKLQKEILAESSTAVTQEALDAYAQQVASEYMSFYGNRHYAYPLTLDLDDNTLEWELLDNIVINGTKYFFDSMNVDLEEKTLEIELVSVESFAYDLRQAIIALNEQSYVSSSSGRSSSNGYSGYYSVNPYLWDGGITGLDPALGRQSLGLGNILSDIAGKEPSIPVGNTSQYWRGDKTWQDFNGSVISALSSIAPIAFNSSTGVFSLSFTTNLKLTGNQIDTIQDIRPTGSIRHAFIGAGGEPDGVNPLKVYGNGNITGNLIVGGDIYFGGKINEVNEVNLNVEDKIIALNKGGDSVTAIGGGFILKGTGDIDLVSFLYDGTNLVSNKPIKAAGITAAADLLLNPTGALKINSGSGAILPVQKYREDLGSMQNKFRSLYCSEFFVETLVAQDTIGTIGGRILVGPTTSLVRDLSDQNEHDTIYVKHNQMATNDIVYLEAGGKVEFMKILGPAYPVTDGYSYEVQRNLDGSGLNLWFAGDAILNTGQAGNGFIDLYSVRGVKSSSQAGPAIVGNIRNSLTYNDWSEIFAIGNIKGNYGYGSNTFGLGIGKFANSSSYMTYDPVNGMLFKNKTAAGVERVAIKLGQDGSGWLGEGYINWDAGQVLRVGNWKVEQNRLSGVLTSGTITKSAALDSATPYLAMSVRNSANAADALDAYVGGLFGNTEFGFLLQVGEGVNAKRLLQVTKRTSDGLLTAQLAGFNFDWTKMWSNNFRIETGTSFKGIAVSDGEIDTFKAGEFEFSDESFSTAAISTVSAWNTNDVLYSDYGYDQWLTESAGITTLDNSAAIPDEYATNSFRYAYNFNKLITSAAMLGNTLEATFNLRELENSSGSDKLNVIAFFRYKMSNDPGAAYIIGGMQNITPASVDIPGGTTNFVAKTIRANIPAGALDVRFFVRAFRQQTTGGFAPANVIINSLAFKYYNKSFTQVTGKGLRIASSPINKFEYNTTKNQLTVPQVTSDVINIGNFTLMVGSSVGGDMGINETLRIMFKGKNIAQVSQTGAYTTYNGQ